MTVLSPPRPPIVAEALGLARAWCHGHVIDGAPALRHAVEVAVTLGRYLPAAPPELLAAVLLHDSPQWTVVPPTSPDFAPDDLDLDEVLTVRFGPATARVVRALEREHAALGQPAPPVPDLDDPMVLWASTADKIVSLGSVVRRASLAADRGAYWDARAPFLRLVPYFRRFHAAAAAHLPASMAAALDQAVTDAERARQVTTPSPA
jgi:hypothetical protein